MNPASVDQNWLAGNDDGGGQAPAGSTVTMGTCGGSAGLCPKLTQSLTAGTLYVITISTFSNSASVPLPANGYVYGPGLSLSACPAPPPAPPTVSTVNPASGAPIGGTTVTITGTAFTGATGVTIGGNAATAVTVVNDTTITATTPAGSTGTASVLVTTPNGTNAANTLFTYLAAPTVTGISPHAGPLSGGQVVTITGTGLTGATAVTIGGTAATNVTVVNSTTITATVPAGSAGTASVLVTTPNGTNAANTLYTYLAAPTVTGISPSVGPLVGGQVVTITGTGLTGATAVSIGGNAATNVTVVDATTITATTPPGPAGLASVVVTTLGGSNAANALYTYSSAPLALTCSSNAGVPPIVRAEGIAELVGDLILNCKGGTPTAAGQPVPQVNFQIFLNTNVTSRLLSDPWSEALLMVDEPSGSVANGGNLRYCTTLGGCPMTGVGTPGGVNYLTGTTANVFQGRQSGANSLVWLGVPIDPPGPDATRIIRITNVRANANQLGVSSTLIPTQIVMFVSATSTTSIPINQPQQTVAFIQPGMTFSTRTLTSSNYLQCVSNNSSAASNSASGMTSTRHILRFTEGFASAFKKRVNGAEGSADTNQAAVAQNTPNNNFFTESGFYNPFPVAGSNSGALTSGIENAGLASQGTRLMARFTNVPAGVALYASVYGVTSSSTPALTAAATSANSGVRLVSTDGNGSGAFSAVSATNSSSESALTIPSAPIALSNGSGAAVWEVVVANPFQVQDFEVAVSVAYAANTSSNLPGLGTASVAGSFAPLSTVTTASTSNLQPRFADSSTARTLFNVNDCSTNLLFPFLTNQAGFDSGIAIANSSTDPFGTTSQAGPCKLNYYGESTGGGAAPAAQTSAVVPAGKTLMATLSTGGNYGIAATPGFQGYMIAQCRFQYAHGLAFISDVGANRVAEAYTALILDGALGSRTLVNSEVLGH